jgi:hypothetical protein
MSPADVAPRNRPRARASLALAALLALAGCKQPGNLIIDFEWEERPGPDEVVYVMLICEQRNGDPLVTEDKILATDGPYRYYPGLTVAVSDVPPGENRVCIVEGREFPSRESPVIYYGISAPFKTGANIEAHVPL